MRVFLYSMIGIPLLIADAVLLGALPARMANGFTGTQGLILLFGRSPTSAFISCCEKPERMYLLGARIHPPPGRETVPAARTRFPHHLALRGKGRHRPDERGDSISPPTPCRSTTYGIAPGHGGGGRYLDARRSISEWPAFPLHDAPLFFRRGSSTRSRTCGAAADLLPGRHSAPSDDVDSGPCGAGTHADFSALPAFTGSGSPTDAAALGLTARVRSMLRTVSVNYFDVFR